MAVEADLEILWRPPPDLKGKTPIDLYRKHVNAKFAKSFTTTPELQKWTVEQPQSFWMDLYSYLELTPPLPAHVRQAYDEDAPMSSIPQFFTGLELNYTENVLLNSDKCPDNLALIDVREGQDLGPEPDQLTWQQLKEEIRRVSSALRNCGVQKNDVVAALMGNTMRAVVLFLSTAVLGAVFTSISPDLGLEVSQEEPC